MAWRGDVENEFEGNSTLLNESLRYGTLNSADKREVAALKAIIAKSTLKSDAVFYRGVSGNMLKRFTEGKVFTDKGFTSLTTDKKTADLFTGGSRENPEKGLIVEVRVPKGTHILDVTHALGEKRHGLIDEGEHLLTPGTQFKVVKASGKEYILEVMKK